MNAKSRKVAQRLGLSYEGVFRQATISKGHNSDAAWFAAVDKEWPNLRENFKNILVVIIIKIVALPKNLLEN